MSIVNGVWCKRQGEPHERGPVSTKDSGWSLMHHASVPLLQLIINMLFSASEETEPNQNPTVVQCFCIAVPVANLMQWEL